GDRDPDAATFDSGAVLPAPDADDGHPEQHCSGSSAGSHSASASSTAAASRQACWQQDSCEGQLWTGGSPTQFMTASLSLGSSSGSVSAATTSPRALRR